MNAVFSHQQTVLCFLPGILYAEWEAGLLMLLNLLDRYILKYDGEEVTVYSIYAPCILCAVNNLHTFYNIYNRIYLKSIYINIQSICCIYVYTVYPYIPKNSDLFDVQARILNEVCTLSFLAHREFHNIIIVRVLYSCAWVLDFLQII